jgi:hypothetical protein
MPGIDERRANLLHEGMSRPFRLLLPLASAVLALGFSACVGTVYDRMYSYEKTHYKAPQQAKEASAADILGAVDSSAPTTPPAGAPEGLPPADPAGALPPPAGDIPGLPPAMPADPTAAPMVPPPL